MTKRKDAHANEHAAAAAKGAEAGEPVEAVGLKPKITLFGGIGIIVGSIIGSGIFISPKGVLQGTGSVGFSLVAWVLCGLFSMVGAYCYAELGTMIHRSGADYAYMLEAFGPFCAFIRLWVECMVIRPCSTAIIALTFANYILEPIFSGCLAPSVSTRMLAACCILFLTFINCWNVNWSVKVQNVFTVAKVLALVIIIITGIVKLCQGHTHNFENMFEGTLTDPGGISLSLYSGLFAYNGWNYLNYIIEELQNPKKNLPLAIWISIILVTVVYTMTNVAYFTMLTPAEVLASNAVAVTFADRVFGVVSWCIPIFVALSTFGGVNGVLYTSSRLFYVGAREGQMPDVLTHINVFRDTPVPAVIFMGLISLVYLISDDMFALMNYMSFVNWLAIGLSVVILLIFRKTKRDAERPIKVNLIWPIIYVVFSIYLVVVPLYASPKETGIGCAIIATGIPVYFLFVTKWKRPQSFVRFMANTTVAVQKLTRSCPPDSYYSDS